MKNLGLKKTNDQSLTSLKYEERSKLEVAPDEVEIGIVATGLNFRDVLVVLGMYPGDISVLGLECSGVVTKVGSQVTNISPGQPVVAMIHDCFQTYVNCKAAFVYPIKSVHDLIPAATIPVTYLTAWYGLIELAKIKKSDTVLVHAAAGGVGMAALQLCRYLGVRCFATASNNEKQNVARSLGAEEVFNSRVPDFADSILNLTNGRGVDIVLNSLIGEFIDQSLKCMRPNGTFLEIGKRDIRPSEKIKGIKDVNYYPYDIDAYMIENPIEASQMLNQLFQLYGQRKIDALKQHVFPWDQASEAFRFMAKGHHIGKIIITSPLWSNIQDKNSVTPESGTATAKSTQTNWSDVLEQVAGIPNHIAIQEIKK